MTQILARTTSLLDNRKDVEMDVRTYVRAIVPIGVLYSASLVCSNQAYLYLSVALIQMLKVINLISISQAPGGLVSSSLNSVGCLGKLTALSTLG